jgi:putative hemolysin
VETTHSRAPVYRAELDDVVGIVNLRDLVGAPGRVADHARPALALPESMGCRTRCAGCGPNARS